jgi:AcrR family transcriptional regulator
MLPEQGSKWIQASWVANAEVSMARTAATEAPDARADARAYRLTGEPIPIFRRAQPKDCLDLAKATFLNCERVDMGTLATQLATSRSTLYRWFGSREELLEQMLVELAQEFSAAARADAAGEGDERVLDFARRIMNATADFGPLRAFIAHEPQLALRLLIGERGAVHKSIAHAMLEVIAETHSPEEAKTLEHHVDVVVQVATALQWATLAIGEEPSTERAVDIVGVMLAAGRAASTSSA